MSEVEGSYGWHRPMGVATPIFSEFVNEATAVIGAENTDLLKAVDDALNASGKLPAPLALTETEAVAGADAWSAKDPSATDERRAVRRQQYLNHLAFLYELAYRREHGPELFERNAAVTPCPDFLPANSHQVPAGRFARYTRLNKIWNWAFVVAVNGAFPLVLMPFFKSLLQARSMGVRIYPFIAALWAVALAVGIVGRFRCRAMHGRKPGSFAAA